MAHRGARRAVVGAVVAALGVLAACSGDQLAPPPAQPDGKKVCSGAQALTDDAFTGLSLAPKQLALTFDDGPGSQTLALSAYLKSEGIPVAFFVNGHCFAPDTPCGDPGLSPAQVFTQVVADGHIIANHTQDHYDLTSATMFPNGATGDNAIVAELANTDAIIAPYVDHNRFLFRPPYGAWNVRDEDVLDPTPMDKYVGPVRWDIGGGMTGTDASGFAADWDCWQNLDGFGVKTTAQCAARYLNEIKAVGRGITLMHDADYGNIGNHNVNVGKGNTVDMVKMLVPQLKALGYTFVRLDQVPTINAALPPIPPPPPDAGKDASSEAAPPKDAAPPPPGSSGGSGTVPPQAPPPAPDPCASAHTAGRAFPHNASVH